MKPLKHILKTTALDVDCVLKDILKNAKEDCTLLEAMAYSVFSGGKRLRPFLVLEAAKLCRVQKSSALRVAAAIEMIHCYSLIHDDLPAMDNDDMRRNFPTCHKKYDEATAILAGDALLTKAFELLADKQTHHDPQRRCDLVSSLAHACGPQGMVKGQLQDLRSHASPLSFDDLIKIHQLKTSALFIFACEAPALLARASTETHHALKTYARNLGIAFQIQDDIKDKNDDICTGYPSWEEAQNQAVVFAQKARNALSVFGPSAIRLQQLANFILP